MRKALLTTFCLVAIGLCLFGIAGLWHLRSLATTDGPLILLDPLLRMTAIGLWAENTQTPIDLGGLACQIRDRFYTLIAIGITMFSVGIWRFASRRSGPIIVPRFQS